MSSYLHPSHYDLVTPDGYIEKISFQSEVLAHAELSIHEISPAFVGYQLDASRVVFNFKSILAQLGLHAVAKEITFDRMHSRADVFVEIHAIGSLAKRLLAQITPGMYIGKLFAMDERRCVQHPRYLSRMFGRSDREGDPLLSLGGMQGSELLTLETDRWACHCFFEFERRANRIRCNHRWFFAYDLPRLKRAAASSGIAAFAPKVESRSP